MKSLTYRLLFVVIAAGLCVLDQLSKSTVRDFLSEKQSSQLELIPGFLRLVYRHNTGGAFSILDNRPAIFMVLPVVLAVVIVVLLFIQTLDRRGLIASCGLCLMLGGATGNLIDRFRQGQVFDFIECYIGNARWPAFNMADSCIVIGTIIFAATVLLPGRNPKINDT